MSVRREIYGVTLTREKIPDMFGEIRLHWCLKNENQEILIAEKRWDNMLDMLMVYANLYFNKGDAQ